ncbi:MAG: MFS transporter [Pseudomonadota bacterium]
MNTSGRKTKSFVIACALSLMTALVLFSVLVLSSLHKQYYEDAIALDTFVSSRFANTLSRSAKFGISPKRLHDLTEQVAVYQETSNAYRTVILDKNCDIITQHNYDNTHFVFPQELKESTTKTLYFEEGDTTWIAHPVLGQKKYLFQAAHGDKRIASPLEGKIAVDPENTIEGYVLHGIETSSFTATLKELVYNNVYYLAGIGLSATLLLCLLVHYVMSSETIQSKSYKKVYMYVAMFIPFLLAQGIFMATLYTPMRAMQETSMVNMASQLGNQIASDISRLHRLGIRLQDVPDAKIYFKKIQERFHWNTAVHINEEGAEINIVNPYYIETILGKRELKEQNLIRFETEIANNIRATEEKPLAGFASISSMVKATPDISIAHNAQQQSLVTVYISKESLQDSLISILLDILTITVITLIFLVEFIAVIFMYDESVLQKKTAVQESLHSQETTKTSVFHNAYIIRTIAFAMFFGVFLSISFIPLRMAEISPSLFGLSKDVSMSLPVSMEMFCAGLAIVMGGVVADKYGWRPILLAGSAFVALGSFASAFFDSALLFLGARCLAGFGYGGVNLSIQLFVFDRSNPEQRAQSIASMLAGAYAGLLCGSAFGGLIADRLGYSATFYVACLIMLSTCLVLAKHLPKQDLSKLQASKSAEKKERFSLADLKYFFTNIPMLGLLMMNIVPCAFATVCLFNYYIPVSLHAANASTADIGRVSMFYCLIVIYLGPVLGRIIDRSASKISAAKGISPVALWLFVAGIACVISIAIFSLSTSISMAILGIIILGICNSIAFSAQGTYALSLPIVDTFGQGKVVASYNLAERVGQVLGPICLAVMIASLGAQISLQLLAGITLAMTVLFAISAKVKQ